MASTSEDSSARPMISLSTLPILESSSQWVKWSRDIKDYLTMTGFGDLLARNASLPEQGTLSAETWEAKKESWTAKQERACAVIRNRLGYNARESVKLRNYPEQNRTSVLTHRKRRLCLSWQRIPRTNPGRLHRSHELRLKASKGQKRTSRTWLIMQDWGASLRT